MTTPKRYRATIGSTSSTRREWVYLCSDIDPVSHTQLFKAVSAQAVSELTQMMQNAPVTLTVLAGLYAIATGQIKHTNNGLCPDQVEGPAVRNDECPACQVLLAADAQLAEAGALLPAHLATATPAH